MAFKLNVASFTSEAGEISFSEVGTLAKHAKGMTIRFSKKNLKSDKRVTLLLTDKKGETFTLPCTAPLSESIRAALAAGKEQQSVLSALLKLTIIQNDDDESMYFLNAPDGGQGSTAFAVEDLAKEDEDFDEVLGGY